MWTMNSNLAKLQPYPFERLTALFKGAEPPAAYKPIVMSIGEPRQASPDFVGQEISEHLAGLSSYPATQGSIELRIAIAKWLTRRFSLKANSLDPDRHILPVNGTREALFAIAQCLVDAGNDAFVLMPNPFYQIYEGAALLAGSKPYYINITDKSNLIPDFDSVPEKIWRQCQLLYVCSPGNPTGAVINIETFQKLIELADQYDFVIASDECYSEIYFDDNKPPAGLLQAAAEMGRNDYKRCLVFNSLSKRSSLPGLRSGLVAGDAGLIEQFRLYRTYHGSAMSPPTQAVSAHAWQDEVHVKQMRELYKQKFAAFADILAPAVKIPMPAGAFFVWLATPIDDKEFACKLYQKYNLTVLPGSFLSRVAQGVDPGKNYVRIALVGTLAECNDAAQRLKQYWSAGTFGRFTGSPSSA